MSLRPIIDELDDNSWCPQVAAIRFTFGLVAPMTNGTPAPTGAELCSCICSAGSNRHDGFTFEWIGNRGRNDRGGQDARGGSSPISAVRSRTS